MEKFQPPRGTRDLLPAEMAGREALFSRLRGVFRSYGYGEVWTPAFEDFDLLARKSGPDIEQELYVFTDKAGRKLGLRFDPTVPICRIVASSPNLPKPMRFCYLTNMWRYDRPQKGRWREFWQAGVELLGSPRPEADAEVLAVAADCMRAAGLKRFAFRVNSRTAVEALAKEAGIPEGKKADALRALDKLAKVGKAGVEKELQEKGIPRAKAEAFLGLVGQEGGRTDPGIARITELLKEMGITNVRHDPSVVRGIDYYTGFVFETMVEGHEDLGSVASGGRYDTLVGLYGGGEVPATGFGMGIDRVMEILGTGKAPVPHLLVAPVREELAGNALSLAGELRARGVACEAEVMGRSLRKQLEYADSRGIPHLLFVGEKELKAGAYTLRDMQTGKEQQLSLEAVAKQLRG